MFFLVSVSRHRRRAPTVIRASTELRFELGWRQIAKARVRSHVVVVPSPLLDPHLRVHAVPKPPRLTWRQLYQQFGVDPAKASDKRIVKIFRRQALRELKKIKPAWADLNCRTVKGALVVSPSPPRIAPSQLRLVE